MACLAPLAGMTRSDPRSISLPAMPRGTCAGHAIEVRADRGLAGRLAAASPTAAILLAALLVSCAKPVPNSPSLNRTVKSGNEIDDRWASTVLDASQRAEVEGVFRSLPGSLTSAQVGPGPVPAPRGRWIDIPDAARIAASNAEVAIVSTTCEPTGSDLDSADRIVFSIVTLTAEPGRLEITRGDADEVYRATATIGLLGERSETARILLEELAREVVAFGRRPELAPIAE